MGDIVVRRVSNKLADRMRGRDVVVEIRRTKNPIQRKQWIRAVATIEPATFTKRAVTQTELFYMPFMEAVEKAQARWPGKRISYTTLVVEAAKKLEPVPAKKAE